MSFSNKNSILFPVLLLLFAVITTQIGAAIAAKHLFPLVGTEGASALRYFISAILLGILFKPWRMRIPRESWLPTFLYGLSLGCMGFFFYMALKRIPLGITVGLEIIGPLSMALFSSRRPSDIIWIIFAVVGIWLLIPHSETAQSLDPIGMFYALLAGAFWVVYATCARKVSSLHGAKTVSLGVAISALVFLPVGIINVGPSIFTLESIIFATMVSILSTAIPFTLELITLSKIPLRVYGTLTSLEPAIAALSGILVLNQHLTWTQWLAILSICAAAIGTTTTVKPSEISPTENNV